jgi:hypothetical protein
MNTPIAEEIEPIGFADQRAWHASCDEPGAFPLALMVSHDPRQIRRRLAGIIQSVEIRLRKSSR